MLKDKIELTENYGKRPIYLGITISRSTFLNLTLNLATVLSAKRQWKCIQVHFHTSSIAIPFYLFHFILLGFSRNTNRRRSRKTDRRFIDHSFHSHSVSVSDSDSAAAAQQKQTEFAHSHRSGSSHFNFLHLSVLLWARRDVLRVRPIHHPLITPIQILH